MSTRAKKCAYEGTAFLIREMNGERERCESVGRDVSRQAEIRCASINMLDSLVYFVPTGKNRPSSQGRRWRLQLACIITSHKSAPTGREETQGVGGSIGDRHSNTCRVTQVRAKERKNGSDWLATAAVWVEEMCGWKYSRGGVLIPALRLSPTAPSLLARSTIQPSNEMIWFTTLLEHRLQRQWKMVLFSCFTNAILYIMHASILHIPLAWFQVISVPLKQTFLAIQLALEPQLNEMSKLSSFLSLPVTHPSLSEFLYIYI